MYFIVPPSRLRDGRLQDKRRASKSTARAQRPRGEHPRVAAGIGVPHDDRHDDRLAEVLEFDSRWLAAPGSP
jgi:hypothetical protein